MNFGGEGRGGGGGGVSVPCIFEAFMRQHRDVHAVMIALS